jgi:flavin reductase (DIM6/NTAB) family NADH-FMN oxidoreductase RutF
VDPRLFKTIMASFPSGVAIMTSVDDEGRPQGLTLNATCSVSLSPPLLLACLDRGSNTLQAVRSSGRFAVNYLAAGRSDLSDRFASSAADKFSGINWRRSAAGLPVLYRDVVAHAECTVENEIEAGDHVVILGAVVAGSADPEGTQPLLYFRRTYDQWPVGLTAPVQEGARA